VLSRKKGVSEIVASLILLFIASSVGVFLYSIAMTTTNTQMTQVRNQAEREIEQATERFRITSVSNSTSREFIITVLNYGDVETKIVSTYANGEMANMDPSDGVVIPIDEIRNISFTTSQDYLQEPIEFNLVSEKGTSYKASWAPE
jgi:hypothetical protein